MGPITQAGLESGLHGLSESRRCSLFQCECLELKPESTTQEFRATATIAVLAIASFLIPDAMGALVGLAGHRPNLLAPDAGLLDARRPLELMAGAPSRVSQMAEFLRASMQLRTLLTAELSLLVWI